MANITWTRRDGLYDSLYWFDSPHRYNKKGIPEPKARGSKPGLWNDFEIWYENTAIPNTTFSLILRQNIRKISTLKKKVQAKCTPRRQSPTIRQQKLQLLGEYFDGVELSGTFRDFHMADYFNLRHYFNLRRHTRFFVTELLKGEHNISQTFLKICIFANMRSICKTENKTVETAFSIKIITQL